MSVKRILIYIISFIVLYYMYSYLTNIYKTTKLVFKGKGKDITLPQLCTKNYRAYNPSVAKIGKNYICTYRISNSINCTALDNMHSFKKLKSGEIESFIVISLLDEDFNTISKSNVSTINVGTDIKGFEDPRIIISGNEIFIVANALTGPANRNEMWLLKFNTFDLMAKLQNGDVIKPYSSIKLTIDFDTDKVQKNWMPFLYNDNLMFVYSVNPHTILQCDTISGRCEKVCVSSNSEISSEIRGGSPAKLYGDVYIALTHKRPRGGCYTTQIYTFDSQPPFAVRSVSDDFIFDEKYNINTSHIQFVSGFEISDDKIIISYGEDDCHSKLYVAPIRLLLDKM
jgi:predicted GH43/DUF377 family glycosyl hydrolase